MTRNRRAPRKLRLPTLGEVNVYVREMEAVKDVYRETLGFNVPSSADTYPLPSGLAVSEILFRVGPVLEFRSVHDREKAMQQRPRAVDFLQEHEGALTLVLNVKSVRATATALRRHGFDVSDPQPAPFAVNGKPPFQFLVFRGFFNVAPSAAMVSEGLPPRVVAFSQVATFMERRFQNRLLSPEFKTWLQHPNTAIGIRSVWIAVKDLEAAAEAYASIGLPCGATRKARWLRADGREIRVDGGRILLLQPSDNRGKVASFFPEREEGIIGLSVEVQDLLSARRLIQRKAKRILSAFDRPHRRSVLIPAELAHGVWIEMFQRR